MSKKNGALNKEEAQKSLETMVMPVVNMDEVVLERIPVKIRYYKIEPVLDDLGEPLIDEETGHPLTYRVAHTRTASILNHVPVDLYNEALGILNAMPEASMQEQSEVMTDFVFKVWKNTEPWMTRSKFSEGLDYEVMAGLFTRFFGNRNRLQSARAEPESSTTPDESDMQKPLS